MFSTQEIIRKCCLDIEYIMIRCCQKNVSTATPKYVYSKNFINETKIKIITLLLIKKSKLCPRFIAFLFKVMLADDVFYA